MNQKGNIKLLSDRNEVLRKCFEAIELYEKTYNDTEFFNEFKFSVINEMLEVIKKTRAEFEAQEILINQHCQDFDCNDTWDSEQPDCKCGNTDFTKCKLYCGDLQTLNQSS